MYGEIRTQLTGFGSGWGGRKSSARFVGEGHGVVVLVAIVQRVAGAHVHSALVRERERQRERDRESDREEERVGVYVCERKREIKREESERREREKRK